MNIIGNIIDGCLSIVKMGRQWQPLPPQITQQLPTKQPHRKTGIAQSRRDARKRRNRK